MKILKRTILTAALLALLVPGCASPGPAGGAAAPPPPSSAEAGGQTIVAIAAPSPPQQTLPQWLGINDLFTGVGSLLQMKHMLLDPLFPQLSTGLPFLQPPPLLKPITDPSNLSEDAPPVVQAAAEAKAEEDAALQKIAAIEALKRIGCVKGRPKVEKGLLAALDDPTEKVRYAAVSALHELSGHPCETCQSGQCCSPAIYNKLHEIATKEAKPGCFVEPSARVRRLARLAMLNCGAPPTPAPPQKIEGPTPPLPSPPEKIEGPLPPPPAPAVGEGATAKTEKSTPAKQSPPVIPATHETKQPEPEKAPAEPVIKQTSHSKEAKTETTESNTEHGTLKWERMTAPTTSFRSRQEAYATIMYLRSRALGIKTDHVPRFQRTQLQIQAYDWADLKPGLSPVLAKSLISLPVGQISPILEDGAGFHIVRVLGRRNADAPTQTAKTAPAKTIAKPMPIANKQPVVQPDEFPAKKTEVASTPPVKPTETKPQTTAEVQPPMPPVTQAKAETKPPTPAPTVSAPIEPKETVKPAIHVAQQEKVEPAIIPSALASQPDRNTFSEVKPRDVTGSWRNTLATDSRRNAIRIAATLPKVEPMTAKAVQQTAAQTSPQPTSRHADYQTPAFSTQTPPTPASQPRPKVEDNHGYTVRQPSTQSPYNTQQPVPTQSTTPYEQRTDSDSRYSLRSREERRMDRTPIEYQPSTPRRTDYTHRFPEPSPQRRGNVTISHSRPERSKLPAKKDIHHRFPAPITTPAQQTETPVQVPQTTSPIQRTTNIAPAKHAPNRKPTVNHAEFTRPQLPATKNRPLAFPADATQQTTTRPAQIRSGEPGRIQSRQSDAEKRDLFSDFDTPTDPKKIAEARTRALKEALKQQTKPRGLLKEADFGNWEFDQPKK